MKFCLREMPGFVHQATGAGMEAAHNAGLRLAAAGWRTDMMLNRPFTVSPEGKPLFG
jgi:hypothetical protein